VKPDTLLKSVLSPLTVLVGVGNLLRGDDAFGPLFIQEILTRGYDLKVLDAGTSPENHVSRIAQLKPSRVVLVDTVHFEAEPGTFKLFRGSELGIASLTTHGLPLSVLMDEIQNRTGAPVLLLGVQPDRLTMGEALSPPVQAALEEALGAVETWANQFRPNEAD
jgi:hydrogenase 3 maturation protease